MEVELANRRCRPCRKNAPLLDNRLLPRYLERLGSRWRIVNEHHLRKKYEFRDFKQALAFVNRIGVLAEEMGHHPDISLSWGLVTLVIFTHKVNGLTENDFILAAKADRIYET